MDRFRFNYDPPEEYNLRVIFTRVDGYFGIFSVLSHQGHTFRFGLGDDNNCTIGCMVQGNPPGSHHTVPIPAVFKEGRTYTAIIYVRKDFVAASVDGRLVMKYKTDFSDLRLPDNLPISGGTFGIGVEWSNVVFHTIEVAEISGEGKLLAAR